VCFRSPELESQELREELPLPVIAPLLGLGLLGIFSKVWGVMKCDMKNVHPKDWGFFFSPDVDFMKTEEKKVGD